MKTVPTFNLGHFITQNAERLPNQAGLIAGDTTLTWSELNIRVDRLARSLRNAGVGSNDRVVVQARNGSRAFEIKWACFKNGTTWVPVNFRLAPDEVAYITERSAPKAFFFDQEFEAHFQAGRRSCAREPLAICIDEQEEHLSYESFLSIDGAPIIEAHVESDHPAWFFYTSGTTGRPKAAVLTHGQLAFVITSQLADMFPNVSEADTSLIITPLSHGAGVHALAYVARGATQVIHTARSLNPEEVWEAVQRHKVTNFFTVPTLLKTLVEHPSVDAYNHSALRHVNYGGAPMFRADQSLALKKLGKVLVQHYGLGEFTANITVLSPELHEEREGASNIGSCGRARTGIEVGILDPLGNNLPVGETGEICARGEAAFAGYYDDPEATTQAFRDGWFHTGDLGHLDERGFLFITGRASDMYISGGVNVYPREIEELILEDGRVSETAVVGIPHVKWGECGVAVIVTYPNCRITESEIRGLLAGRIARFKMPSEVVFWDALPKSAYGKVLKREVTRMLCSSFAPDRTIPSAS